MRLKSLSFFNVVIQTITHDVAKKPYILIFILKYCMHLVGNFVIIMLFICINFPRLAVKDVTSRDSFLEIVAQTILFRVWSGTQVNFSRINRISIW